LILLRSRRAISCSNRLEPSLRAFFPFSIRSFVWKFVTHGRFSAWPANPVTLDLSLFFERLQVLSERLLADLPSCKLVEFLLAQRPKVFENLSNVCRAFRAIALLRRLFDIVRTKIPSGRSLVHNRHLHHLNGTKGHLLSKKIQRRKRLSARAIISDILAVQMKRK